MIINVLEQIKPDYAVAALDGEKPTFRVEDFTGYKAHRRPMEDALNSQIPKVMEILDAFGIKRILIDGYEADDIIGTLAARYGDDESQNVEVVIVSNDKDLWQLVNSRVVVMIPTTTGKVEWLGSKEIEARMGFIPKYIVDYKGLRGDPSDNIPGVFGVGEKTAKDLIQKYGTVEDIYKNIDKVTPKSLQEKLANCVEQAVMSKKLAKIQTDVPLQIELSECRYTEFNKLRVVEILKRYNFKSLIRRLGFGDEENSRKKKEVVPDNQLGLF